MTDVVELHAIAKGNVQGVGFRYMTQRFANGLKLTGFVRNMPDGTVEIIVQGRKVIVQQLLNELKTYFQLAEDTFREKYQLPTKQYIGFQIHQ